LTEAAQIADTWKGYCEDLYHDEEGVSEQFLNGTSAHYRKRKMRKGMELNKNIGSKSLHYLVQIYEYFMVAALLYS